MQKLKECFTSLWYDYLPAELLEESSQTQRKLTFQQ